MTETPRERYKRLLPVIEAWCRGEPLQIRQTSGHGTGLVLGWVDYAKDAPRWDETNFDWRIKPKAGEWWLVFDGNGGAAVFIDESHATGAFPDCRPIHVREVIEG